ncbi:RHS repeat-associated core domain-containing protein, partial [Vibrio parahaemolyticus]
KEEDFEVGLTYFGARYYSPLLGAWASPDPLTVHNVGADINPYGYVHGRVTGATDPLGLDDDRDEYDRGERAGRSHAELPEGIVVTNDRNLMT